MTPGTVQSLKDTIYKLGDAVYVPTFNPSYVTHVIVDQQDLTDMNYHNWKEAWLPESSYFLSNLDSSNDGSDSDGPGSDGSDDDSVLVSLPTTMITTIIGAV